jgi:hypothetical protein
MVSVGAYWYYSSQMKGNQIRTGRINTLSKIQEPARRRADGKGQRKKGRENITERSAHTICDRAVTEPGPFPGSRIDQAEDKKGKDKNKKRVYVPLPTEAHTVQNSNDTGRDDVVDNREFARQLSGVITGTSLTTPGKTIQQGRTKKHTRANGFSGAAAKLEHGPEVRDFSTSSSTTGADADDNSAVSSPTVEAIQSIVDPSGVSDMLGPSAPGPAVLHITEIEGFQPARRPKQPKAAQEQETKKQRQNKAKNDARKVEREQVEKERRVLLEKQLRTARDAEGRPARNGVLVPKPPSSSVWEQPADRTQSSSSSANITNSRSISLLDTFEDAPKPSNTAVNSESTTPPSQKTWERAIPSEEEQMRIISQIEGDEAWETVGSFKKRERTKKSDADQGVSSKPFTALKSSEEYLTEPPTVKTVKPEIGRHLAQIFDKKGQTARWKISAETSTSSEIGIGTQVCELICEDIAGRPEARYFPGWEAV